MKKHLLPIILARIGLCGISLFSFLPVHSQVAVASHSFRMGSERLSGRSHFLHEQRPLVFHVTKDDQLAQNFDRRTKASFNFTDSGLWWIKRLLFLHFLTFLALLYYTCHRELEIQQKKLRGEQAHRERLRQINQAMGKFVPREFLIALGRKRITEVARGDHAERTVTVLFSDIRDYTALAESMTPEENYRFVNAFLGRMGPVVQSHGGFVNQYLGDAIMAIFPNTPADALSAAVEMQTSLRTYNLDRQAKGRIPIRMGVGIHTGPIIMGIIGDENRLDAAVISDTVNTASRVENLTRHFGANILISEHSVRQAKLGKDLKIRRLGRVQVLGKKDHVGIYECLCGEPPEGRRKKMESLPDFELGIQNFFGRKFPEAVQAFRKVLKANADDQAARLFLEKAVSFIQNGVPEEWNGVEMMEGK